MFSHFYLQLLNLLLRTHTCGNGTREIMHQIIISKGGEIGEALLLYFASVFVWRSGGKGIWARFYGARAKERAGAYENALTINMGRRLGNERELGSF